MDDKLKAADEWHDDFAAWWESPETERRFHCGHFSDKEMAAAAIGWYIGRAAQSPAPQEPRGEAGYMAIHEREQNWLADHMNPADPNFATIAARLATIAQPAAQGGDGVRYSRQDVIAGLSAYYAEQSGDSRAAAGFIAAEQALLAIDRAALAPQRKEGE